MKRLWLKAASLIQGQARLGEFNLLWAFQPADPATRVSLPLINALWQEYAHAGLHILGLSTGYEQFGADAEAETCEMLADPQTQALFPVMMDYRHTADADIPESYLSFLCERIPFFADWPLSEQEALRLKARRYLASKNSWAVTLTLNEFNHTPVMILFNRYYEILEYWAGTADTPAQLEEVYASIEYWLSHVKADELNVDPF